MNLTLEDTKQINTVPDQHYKPTQKEESALLTENTKEEHDGRVDTSSYVADTKRQCCSHSTPRELDDEKNVTGRSSAGTPILISQGFYLKKKHLRHECVKNAKRVHICLLVSVVAKIGLTITVVLLATKVGKNVELERENDPLLHLPKEHFKDSLCIPCNYLGSTIKAEYTLFDSITPCGSKLCCIRNGTLQKLFLLMLQEGSTSKATKERLDLENYTDGNTTISTWRSRIIAAHVYAKVTSLPEKLTWQTDAGHGTAFTHGITLTPESRLQVPRAGFYFIYSTVTFKCQTEPTTALVHRMNRQHKNRPNAGVQTLLLSKPNECGSDGIYSSFLAGVMKLTNNDELSVSLNDFSLTSVYKSTLSNYFGLYLI
ncbi:hypothetical protein CHS0354_032339 [Potamilus streckersoni]|uniref:THD domain-containing protein n=1 Tax=Potamilus streckersoni TaxID=2493646 RepID=A0AAE0TGK6_9BIVA|nr:hypothetical protein CHS0354_032339 [Potamilus streckersoni]